jgi:DNA invertase Pin-like site-specific DNA recombinase
MPKAKKDVTDPSKVVGYVRVSTGDQADSGLGLAAQKTAIRAQCEARGWTLVAIHEDAGLSGKTMTNRPGLAAALKDVESGGIGGLVVAKLDRLSRSLKDFALLMERAQKRGWNLVACDLGIDLSTPSGEFMAAVMSSAAQWERRLIGQRTKDALAEKRAQGIKLGRPQTLPQAVVQRILMARMSGDGWSAIARKLDAEQVATAHGGTRWYPSTVRAVALANEAHESGGRT